MNFPGCANTGSANKYHPTGQEGKYRVFPSLDGRWGGGMGYNIRAYGGAVLKTVLLLMQ